MDCQIRAEAASSNTLAVFIHSVFACSLGKFDIKWHFIGIQWHVICTLYGVFIIGRGSVWFTVCDTVQLLSNLFEQTLLNDSWGKLHLQGLHFYLVYFTSI